MVHIRVNSHKKSNNGTVNNDNTPTATKAILAESDKQPATSSTAAAKVQRARLNSALKFAKVSSLSSPFEQTDAVERLKEVLELVGEAEGYHLRHR